MIEALDETIRQLLIQKMPLNQAEVDISFEAPDREWSGAISKPTINIYLHDIRENLELRQNEWALSRNSDGTVTKTKAAPYFDLSYLITVWTTNIEDEHRLLWYVLQTLIRFNTIPGEVVQEPLNQLSEPLLAKTGRPDGILRNVADVWTALDNQLKPVLPYVVTLSLQPYIFETAPEVRSKFLHFNPPESDAALILATRRGGPRDGQKADPLQTPAGVVQFMQIGGTVRDATDPDKPVRAEVVLVEQGLNVRTDEEGRYTFSNLVKRPQYTVLVVAPGYATTRQVLTVPSASYDVKLEREKEGAGV